jgi:putative flippase GtrA
VSLAARSAPQASPRAPSPGLGRPAHAIAREWAKYLAASVAALAVDYALLVFLTEVAHLHYLVSAAIGFSAGLVVTYALSVTVIFKERRFGRTFELGGFVVIGLLGLGLNELLLKGMVDGLSLHYALAKVPAAGISFLFNFAARRLILFTAPSRGEAAASDG